MRKLLRPTLPIELALLVFFLVFLIYPLVFILPGAVKDETYDVYRGAVLERSFPLASKAAAEKLQKEIGADASILRQRHWTGFYFDQAVGFRFKSSTSFPYFQMRPNSPVLWECLNNSLLLGFTTTLATTVICLPLAYWFARLKFRGRGLLSTLLLVPLLVPPFVGAVGLERFLNRFGSLNLWLVQLGLKDVTDSPIDWLGEGGFLGVVILQMLHLYPILYLNLSAAWANLDMTLEDAARNLGASEWRIFRTITLPLLLPGYFAGASLVFVWAFTDLGTPLVFNFTKVIPIQIYDQVSNPQVTNSVAYALVVVTLFVTGLLFYSARWLVSRSAYLGGGKGAVATVLPKPGILMTAVIYVVVISLTLIALLPDVGVLLTALAERWSFTPLPEEVGTRYLREVWTNRIASLSIRNSLFYSACSTGLDLALGVTIAWLVVRRPSWLASVLDGLAMLPLALPGLVLAFGYLTCYSSLSFGSWAVYLDPTKNPALLLVLAYTVRRLPYITRSAQAGLQQVAPVLEEAAENLGAGRIRVMATITLPLIAANLLAGAILTFAFALLEVSDSLMLAREEKYFPITRAIVGLLMRPDDGDKIACALGVFAMALLAGSLFLANLALGRKLGEMFRA